MFSIFEVKEISSLLTILPQHGHSWSSLPFYHNPLSYVVIKQLDQPALLTEQIKIAEPIGSSMYLCFLDGGIGEDVDQDLTELILIIIIVGIQEDS